MEKTPVSFDSIDKIDNLVYDNKVMLDSLKSIDAEIVNPKPLLPKPKTSTRLNKTDEPYPV